MNNTGVKFSDAIEQRADFGIDQLDASIDYVKTNKINLSSALSHAYGIALCQVRWFPERRFEFDDAGTTAAVIFALDQYGNPADLISWSIKDPTKFAPMFGTVPMLGHYQLAGFDRDEIPVRVFRSPLTWLQHRCRGTVIVDADRARLYLGAAFGPILAEDRDHAADLRRLLKRQVDVAPPAPTRLPMVALKEAA